jgi:hypothetical protein
MTRNFVVVITHNPCVDVHTAAIDFGVSRATVGGHTKQIHFDSNVAAAFIKFHFHKSSWRRAGGLIIRVYAHRRREGVAFSCTTISAPLAIPKVSIENNAAEDNDEHKKCCLNIAWRATILYSIREITGHLVANTVHDVSPQCPATAFLEMLVVRMLFLPHSKDAAC